MSKTIFSDGLGYEGKVTLTLKSKDRVLKSKTYKNNGTAQLFKFLGYCLIDAYEEAKNLLPNKILLLRNDESTNPAVAVSTNVEQCSTWQTYIQTPTIISDSSDSLVKVVYSFEVPRAAIASNFNQVALYGAGINDKKDFSAYYYLIDNTGRLEEINVQEWSATTVLLIEWELSISNKNVEVNTNQGEQING